MELFVVALAEVRGEGLAAAPTALVLEAGMAYVMAEGVGLVRTAEVA